MGDSIGLGLDLVNGRSAHSIVLWRLRLRLDGLLDGQAMIWRSRRAGRTGERSVLVVKLGGRIVIKRGEVVVVWKFGGVDVLLMS